MDAKQQLQRLLDLADETRRRTRDLGVCQSVAASELDAAEYDLKQVVDEIRALLPAGERFVPPQPERRVARRFR